MIKMLRNEKGRFTGRDWDHDPRFQKLLESERGAVKAVLDLCGILKLKPEDLGLKRGRPDEEYQLTYKACQILKGRPAA